MKIAKKMSTVDGQKVHEKLPKIKKRAQLDDRSINMYRYTFKVIIHVDWLFQINK